MSPAFQLSLITIILQFLVAVNQFVCQVQLYKRKRLQRLRFVNHLMENSYYYHTRAMKLKKQLRKQRSDDWWVNTVQKSFLEEDWLENFRMSSSTFKMICKRLEPHLKAQENFVHTPHSIEKKVAIAIYKLASCGSYRVVANQFGTNKTDVHRCLYTFCKAMLKEFQQDYLRMPNRYECVEISDGFEEMCGIPNVIGAIDGCHIPILPPKYGRRDFINRKGWPSFNLMAVVDNMHRFRYATIQHAGSSHDAVVLSDSELYKNVDEVIPRETKEVNHVNIPYFIVGDPAYPLLPWLMKSYTGKITPEEESFNAYLNRAHIVVEQAFGRLKGRFRCLMKRLDVHYKFVPKVVLTCLILNNIIETRKDVFHNSWLEASANAEIVLPQPPTLVLRDFDDLQASSTRDALKNYMLKFPLLKSRLAKN